MKIDVYTATGTKKGSLELPSNMFEAKINQGLMHLALVRQQSNRRKPIAHVKHRGEIVGSTKKMFQQKGTGRARRGPIRSPLLKGGGKAFGPRNEANFVKDMPKKMRRAALFSCLSLRAKEGAIIGLENYPEDVKTKTFMALLKKLPVEFGRRILVVMDKPQKGLELSARNVPRVKTLLAQYLNPEDLLVSKNIIFLTDAVKVAEETFTAKSVGGRETSDGKPTKPKSPKKPAKEKSLKSLDSSASLESSKKKKTAA